MYICIGISASDVILLQNSKFSFNDKFTLLSHVSSKKDLRSYDESYNDLNIQRNEPIKDHVSKNIMGPSFSMNINTETELNLCSIINLIIKTDFLF